MKRVRLIISGKVQGVFFREFVKRKAQVYGIKGSVRNQVDGTVEVIAEGEPLVVDELISLCKHGPETAHVKGVSVQEEPFKGEFTSFSIKY